MFIGFALSAIAFSTMTKGSALATIGVPLLAAGVPLFDTILAIWRRSVRSMAENGLSCVGDRLMHADMEHLHHRLLNAGFNQRRVALLLYGVSVILVGIGLLSILFSSSAVGIFLLAFVVGSYLTVRHVAHVELWDSGHSILRGISMPHSRVAVALAFPAVDVILLSGALLLTVVLTVPEFTYQIIKQRWFENLPLWVGLPFLALSFSNTYSRVWSRARVSEFATLFFALSLGVLASWSFHLIIKEAISRDSLLFSLLYFCLSLNLIAAVRAVPRGTQDLLAIFPQRIGATYSDSILVYGAGQRGLLYLRQLSYFIVKEARQHTFIGLIDDDANLRKRLVHGLPVLGSYEDLENILSKRTVSEVVIACDLDSEKLEKLKELSSLYGFNLIVWNPKPEVVSQNLITFSALPAIYKTSSEA